MGTVGQASGRRRRAVRTRRAFRFWKHTSRCEYAGDCLSQAERRKMAAWKGSSSIASEDNRAV
jgi:hypothetical protein